MNATMARRLKILGIIIAGFILVVLPPFLASYWLTILTQILIFGVLAMSLDILMGYSGLPSFGHCAYFGASAYTVAIMSTRYQVGFFGCVLSSLVTAVIIAAIFGLILSHTGGGHDQSPKTG